MLGTTVGVVLAATGIALANGAARPLRLIVRPGELPGFTLVGKLSVYRTARAWAKGDQDLATELDELNTDRFRLGASRLMRGAHGGQAVSVVVELGSPEAARHFRTFYFHPLSKPMKGTRILRHTVPGVPGSRGASGLATNGTRAFSNLTWTEGSCMVEVGEFQPAKTLSPKGLIFAAQAIEKRTYGRC